MSTATSSELARLLDTLERGEAIPDAALPALSDLGREGALLVREYWARIPLTVRHRVLAQAAAMALSDIVLDFRSLAIAALDDPEPAVRRLAIGALWESEDRQAATGLVRALRADADESVRSAAATGLRRFVLLHELGTLDSRLGDDIVAGLRAAAESSAEPVGVRARAVEALGCRSLPWVESLRRDCYYADEAELRRAAVVAMGESADEQWLDYLYEQVQSDDPAFRTAAIAACAVIGSEASVDEVAAFLDDEDQAVAVEAIRALGEIGGDTAAQYLATFEEQVPDDLRGRVRDALEAARGLAPDDAE